MTTAPTPGAMTGLRVIDLTRVLGGPFCTQILADHGADVIKVEPPAGDETRDWGPPFHESDAAYFVGINRNKRSIGLDLASEGGRAVLMKMLERADVLIENFKPGTLDKWGIGSELLRAKFPKLVHCRISGFGADGPRGGNPGYDAIIQAMTGMIAATGSPQSGPMRIGVPVVDITTGLYAAIGILIRSTSGRFAGYFASRAASASTWLAAGGSAGAWAGPASPRKASLQRAPRAASRATTAKVRFIGWGFRVTSGTGVGGGARAGYGAAGRPGAGASIVRRKVPPVNRVCKARADRPPIKIVGGGPRLAAFPGIRPRVAAKLAGRVGENPGRGHQLASSYAI